MSAGRGTVLCPGCRVPLTRSKGPGGVFWVCPTCAGSVIGLGVLRKITSEQLVSFIWQSARQSAVAGPRACPHCGRAMVQTPTHLASGANVVDVCIPCEAVWFDAAEVGALPDRPLPPAEKKLSPKAAEAAAMVQIEHIRQQYEAQEDDQPFLTRTSRGLLRGGIGGALGLVIRALFRVFTRGRW